MLILGIVLGFVLGLAARGDILRLAEVRIRWPALLLAALILRFGTETAIGAGIAEAELLRLPLFGASFGLLLTGLWLNRAMPGFGLAFVGIASNTIAIVANGGAMPIWLPSLEFAGFDPREISSVFHVILDVSPMDLEFLQRAGPLGDVIPIPLPIVQNVASIGDVFLSGGLAFFLFATLVRTSEEIDEATRAQIEVRLRHVTSPTNIGLAGQIEARPSRSETGLAPGLAEAAALDRPIGLGGPSASGSAPASTALPFDPGAGSAGSRVVSVGWPEAAIERARRHPYVRLALNPAFSALWLGNLVSLMGDRIHQLALAFLVYEATGSPAAVGAVFLAAALPNLVLSPIAGTFVDRWDHRRVMVVSDLLRAGLVFTVPIAAMVDLVLIYPLVFALTAVSIFFRPARVAILPRIVREDELLTANSATWIAETLADVVGYPLAGLFVAFLGAALPVAFWLDAASYLGSAVLIATIVVPPMARRWAAAGVNADPESPPNGAAQSAGGLRGFTDELREGWRFLRGETTLLANTLQATVGQFTIGILVALTPIYAADFLDRGEFGASAAYAFLEAGIGAGNLAGGFVMGLIGSRLARGRAVISGYVMMGISTALLGVTGNLGLAIGLMVGSGVANMVFVIPSQTLFQERTPGELLGRVISFRFALVFGAMTIAMGVGGVLAELVGAPAVISAFGLLTVAAGLAGLLVPAVRDA